MTGLLDHDFPEWHRIRQLVTEALPALLREAAVYSTIAMTSISTMRPS
jgi:hypothetical protein